MSAIPTAPPPTDSDEQLLAQLQGRHPDMKIRSANIFNWWDGYGTEPDGFHPNTNTQILFAGWFRDAIK